MIDVIHHIAPRDKDRWHPVWERCRGSFVNHFLDIQFFLWPDDEELDNFVTSNYPQFAVMYTSFPYHIMRIDFARLCLLHYYGGLYADMDYYCYKNFSHYCENSFSIVGNTNLTYTSSSYENCLMFAKPKDPFLFQLMRYVKACFIQYRNLLKCNDTDWRSEITDFAVNNITGSGMISAAISQIGRNFDIGFFPADLFNPPPASWNNSLYGKHMHSSLWGNEYLDHSSRYGVVVKDGQLYNVDKDFKHKNVVDWKDFNFFENYTT